MCVSIELQLKLATLEKKEDSNSIIMEKLLDNDVCTNVHAKYSGYKTTNWVKA